MTAWDTPKLAIHAIKSGAVVIAVTSPRPSAPSALAMTTPVTRFKDKVAAAERCVMNALWPKPRVTGTDASEGSPGGAGGALTFRRQPNRRPCLMRSW